MAAPQPGVVLRGCWPSPGGARRNAERGKLPNSVGGGAAPFLLVFWVAFSSCERGRREPHPTPRPWDRRREPGKSWGTEFKGVLTKQRGFVVRNEPSCGNTQRSCSRNISLASRMLFLAETSETWMDPCLPLPRAPQRLPGFQRTWGTCKSKKHLPPLHAQHRERKFGQGSRASSQLVMASLVQGPGRQQSQEWRREGP